MRKIAKASAVVFTALLLVAPAKALDVGIPFGFGSNTTFGSVDNGYWGHDIGVRLHFSEAFALQPALSFSTRSDNNGSQTNIGINVDALFYLSEVNSVMQYLGGNFGVNITNGDDAMRVGAIYGLQHSLADAIDAFGQVGLGIRFNPSRIYTVNTQLGVIFYIMK